MNKIGNMAEENKLAALRSCIEDTLNRKIATPKDFDWLSQKIYDRLGVMVSATTLKRVWGYLPDDTTQPRQGTLSMLARLVGYTDWESFTKEGDAQKEVQSNMILGRSLSVADMMIGNELLLSWQPNREVRVKYRGMNRFEVTESRNSKLSVGDTFTCSMFIDDEPLYIYNLPYAEAYVCGKKSGIHFEKVVTDRGGASD